MHEQRHQYLLDTALRLFVESGYEAVTLETIAEAAGQSVEDVRVAYPNKAAIAIAHYQQLATETRQQVADLPEGPLADRFAQAMRGKINQMSPYREAVAALYSAAMNPRSQLSMTGPDTAGIRADLMAAFTQVVVGAKDTPRGAMADRAAAILYSLHLLLLLFWLYDRTPESRATHTMIELIHEGLKYLRPLLILPFVDQAITRLADTLASVFGGEPGEDMTA